MALSAPGNRTNRVLLQSNITLHLPWGIKKHQTVDGDIFRVVP
jgi:hypothetical protein